MYSGAGLAVARVGAGVDRRHRAAVGAHAHQRHAEAADAHHLYELEFGVWGVVCEV